jgi:hypothetical protein
MRQDGFNTSERRVFRRLTTPEKIQRFLDELRYNKEEHGPTCFSPRRVVRENKAHCMEGALFAAAALEFQGFPPLLVDLEAVRDDDHVLAVFRQRGHWGAIAKSNYAGLRFREPAYRTLRELAMSYFEHYYNDAGEKTLRTYSRPNASSGRPRKTTYGRFRSISARSATSPCCPTRSCGICDEWTRG